MGASGRARAQGTHLEETFSLTFAPTSVSEGVRRPKADCLKTKTNL